MRTSWLVNMLREEILARI